MSVGQDPQLGQVRKVTYYLDLRLWSPRTAPCLVPYRRTLPNASSHTFPHPTPLCRYQIHNSTLIHTYLCPSNLYGYRTSSIGV